MSSQQANTRVQKERAERHERLVRMIRTFQRTPQEIKNLEKIKADTIFEINLRFRRCQPNKTYVFPKTEVPEEQYNNSSHNFDSSLADGIDREFTELPHHSEFLYNLHSQNNNSITNRRRGDKQSGVSTKQANSRVPSKERLDTSTNDYALQMAIQMKKANKHDVASNSASKRVASLDTHENRNRHSRPRIDRIQKIANREAAHFPQPILLEPPSGRTIHRGRLKTQRKQKASPVKKEIMGGSSKLVIASFQKSSKIDGMTSIPLLKPNNNSRNTQTGKLLANSENVSTHQSNIRQHLVPSIANVSSNSSTHNILPSRKLVTCKTETSSSPVGKSSSSRGKTPKLYTEEEEQQRHNTIKKLASKKLNTQQNERSTAQKGRMHNFLTHEIKRMEKNHLITEISGGGGGKSYGRGKNLFQKQIL